MEPKRNKGVGGATFIMFLAALLLVFWFLSENQTRQSEFTYQEFQQAVNEGKIVSAVVDQNKAVPTGRAIFKMKDGGETRILNVPEIGRAHV